MIVREHFELGETAVTIVAEAEHIKHAQRAIFEARRDLQSFIVSDPFFQLTFEPYRAPSDAPAIVKEHVPRRHHRRGGTDGRGGRSHRPVCGREP